MDSNLGQVVGVGRIKTRHPISASTGKTMYLHLTFDLDSGIVREAQFDGICQVTSQFLTSLLAGKSLYTQLDDMIAAIDAQYFGASGAVFAVALKDAYHKVSSKMNITMT